jgi:serine/threonine protein kinase
MVGQTISQYRVEEELGRGGMGVVYRAYDLRLKREVALELLAQEIANQEQNRERVLAEARAASSLNHPAIITIYEVKEENGLFFIVMELLRGRTLRSLVAGAPNDPRTLSRIGAQIADGLGAAHARGLIHGDTGRRAGKASRLRTRTSDDGGSEDTKRFDDYSKHGQTIPKRWNPCLHGP